MALTSGYSRVENCGRNMNIMFRATSTVEHGETITATSVLAFCNICQASDRWISIRRLSCSTTDLQIPQWVTPNPLPNHLDHNTNSCGMGNYSVFGLRNHSY